MVVWIIAFSIQIFGKPVSKSELRFVLERHARIRKSMEAEAKWVAYWCKVRGPKFRTNGYASVQDVCDFEAAKLTYVENLIIRGL